jgi:hypothetical protein
MVCEQADNKADVVPCDRLPMNTSELWDTLGSLPEEEMVHVVTRLFALYEARLRQNPDDPEARQFFRNLTLAITETCQCNSNRR